MRILICGAAYSHWGAFHPDQLGKEGGQQVGGGETAMVKTAEALAARDHEVIVFTNMQPCHYNGVDYLPLNQWSLACLLSHHVSVSWDAPQMLRVNLKSLARVSAYQLNDAYVGVLDYVIDRYFCPSEWHARRYQTEVTPEATPEKFRPRMTNAVDMDRYKDRPERNPYGVVWSSSPDRGLHHLLAAWPIVKKRQPKARLHVFYDMLKWFELVDTARKQGKILITTERADQVRRGLAKTDGLDVIAHGGVSQAKLAKMQMAQTVGVASLDTIAPTEGFGMTVLEYLAAGLSPIAGAVDAFPELWGDCATLLPPPQEPEVLAEAVLAGFQDGEAQTRGPEVAGKFRWEILGRKWEKEFKELIGE